MLAADGPPPTVDSPGSDASAASCQDSAQPAVAEATRGEGDKRTDSPRQVAQGSPVRNASPCACCGIELGGTSSSRPPGGPGCSEQSDPNDQGAAPPSPGPRSRSASLKGQLAGAFSSRGRSRSPSSDGQAAPHSGPHDVNRASRRSSRDSASGSTRRRRQSREASRSEDSGRLRASLDAARQKEIMSTIQTLAVAEMESDRWVIDPDTRQIKLWYSGCLLATVYNGFAVPMRVAFRMKPGPLVALDFLCDALHMADIVMGFYTGYYDSGNKVKNRSRVQRHYLRTGFAWELLAVLPTDLLQVVLWRWVPAVRLNRLLRMPLAFRRLPSLAGSATTPPAWLKILMLVLRLVLLSHYTACGWFAFALASGFGADPWLPPARLESRSVRSQYLASLYWSLGMLTGLGDGEVPQTVTEGVYTIVILVVGVFFFAYFIGVIGSIDEVQSESARLFQAKMQYVRLSMVQHKLTGPLKQRVINFYHYQFEHCKGADEMGLLEELPEALHVDIMLHLAARVVEKVPFFSDAEEGFTSSLVKLLQPMVCGPGETIIGEGATGEEMFFVLKGQLSVLVCDESVGTLSSGDFFGEYSVLMSIKRSATVVARTYCDFYVLRKEALDAVLVFFPQLRERLGFVVQAKHRQMVSLNEQKGLRVQGTQGTLCRTQSTLADATAAAAPPPPGSDDDGTAPPPPPPLPPPPPPPPGAAGSDDGDAASHRSDDDDDDGDAGAGAAEAARGAEDPGDTSRVATAGCNGGGGGHAERKAHFGAVGSTDPATRADATPGRGAAYGVVDGSSLLRGLVRRLLGRNAVAPHHGEPQSPPQAPLATTAELAPVHRQGRDAGMRRSSPSLLSLSGATAAAVGSAAFVIEPASRVRKAWLALKVVPLLYYHFSIPLRCSFLLSNGWPSPALIALDALCDLMCVGDICLNFSRGFLRDFAVVRSRREIAYRYLRGALLADLVAALPLELLIPLVGPSPLLRLNKLVRTSQLFATFDELLQMQHNSNYAGQKLIKLIIVFVLLSYYVACFYFICARLEGGYADAASTCLTFDGEDGDGDDDVINMCFWSWLPPRRLEKEGVGEQFVHALYFAVISLTGRGRTMTPRTDLQLGFSIIIFFFGTFTIAYVIGATGVLISSMDAAAIAFQRQCTTTNNFIRRKNVPAELQRRVRNYFDCMYVRGAAVNFKKMIASELQPSLRKDVMMTICHSIICKVPLFQDTTTEFTQNLAEAFQFEAYPVHEWIVRKGSIGTHMYFVTFGMVQVLLDEAPGVVVETLGDGSYFGERILVGEYKRNASVQAKTYCECMILSAQDFDRVTQYYPGVKQKILREKSKRERDAALASDIVSRMNAMMCTSSRNSQSPGGSSMRRSVVPKRSTGPSMAKLSGAANNLANALNTEGATKQAGSDAAAAAAAAEAAAAADGEASPPDDDNGRQPEEASGSAAGAPADEGGARAGAPEHRPSGVLAKCCGCGMAGATRWGSVRDLLRSGDAMQLLEAQHQIEAAARRQDASAGRSARQPRAT